MSSAITHPVDHTSIPGQQPASCYSSRPLPRLTDLGRVVGGAKDQFRRSVVPRANVRHIRLVLDENLCAAKVAQLQDARAGVEEEVLRLDVAVADALRVDVRQGPEELVDVELHLEDGHRSLELVEESRRPIDGFRDEFLHQIQVHLVLLRA